MSAQKPVDVPQMLVVLLFVGLLLVASFWIMRPFILSITWASMIVVATWPVLLRLEQRFKGRRWAAILVLIIGQLALLFVPLTLAIATLVNNAGVVIDWARHLADMQTPAAPDWLARVPVLGDSLQALWQQTAASGLGDLAGKVAPYTDDFTRWFAARMGGLGLVIVQFLLTALISFVMYSNADALLRAVRKFAQRLGGSRGADILLLASQAIRGVALGVGVTALVQALLAGLGLAIAGIPAVSLLTAAAFMLCIAQIGAMPILLPACLWLYWSGQTGWGTFMLVWALIVGNIDAVLRPVLIQRGADLPLILILTGVIGGLIGFGLVGIFLGPLILAIAYTLISAWVNDAEGATEPVPLPEAAVPVAVKD